jgi:hypothetical protein
MRIYNDLVNIREDWGGGLVLCCGSRCAHTGAPAAVSIAGGTTLDIGSDASEMKSAMRAGYLDFVVNTLDEALRALKNEIRQKRPLSVGLVSDVESTLAEMVERGVQPDLELMPSSSQYRNNSQLQTLRAHGMPQRLLADGVDDPERPYRPFLILDRERHYEYFFPAPDTAALREIDAALLAAVPAEDVVRRRWLDRIPKYLREARSAGRWIWLSEKELQSLAQRGFSPAPPP